MRPLSSFLPRLAFAIGLSAASIVVLPHRAHAQSADEAEAEQEAMDAQKQAEARKDARRAAPPSALPGAETDSGDNSHARMDINPTAALFDAINRGSLIGAKEALSRGADINARNVLEQTPLDLAIDLGRNDIMFQLLSLRTYNPDGKLITSATHDESSSHITVNGQASLAARAPAPVVENPGQPVPSVGFLGFGGPAAPPARTGTAHAPQRRPHAIVHRTSHPQKAPAPRTAP
ncbi:ankyrin repeat domain-containing protein [Bombella apis]|uniref:Ankyrin repeat domain-containing protein n=1 Tax=Bombella apis TaxID=1785988 RepID=A0ABR9MPV2_9PROT|nr:ankyrin repeat domain-containing protein [Bombella apis]MBE1723866.1 ankyrin repeat domain-containing protein [Bombella apis]MBR9731139.1 ankyrin repeat domain-containing protein [Bombella apis]